MIHNDHGREYENKAFEDFYEQNDSLKMSLHHILLNKMELLNERRDILKK